MHERIATAERPPRRTLGEYPAAGSADYIDRRLIAALMQGRLGDPFALLGPHRIHDRVAVRTYQPGAAAVQVVDGKGHVLTDLAQFEADVIDAPGFFTGWVPELAPGDGYRLRIYWPLNDGADVIQEIADPYAFGLLLGDLDLHLLAEGRHRELGRCLGAQEMTLDGVKGTRFAVWAPNAWRVSVVGDFNVWDGRRHPMRRRYAAGVWELFIPGVCAGMRYKYEIVAADGSLLPQKADPVARATEPPPATASVVAAAEAFVWTDADWMEERAARQRPDRPLSIYEVHAGSWLRILEEDGRNANWYELADRLIPYARDMGFTHIEFLPVMEHPFAGSWGYQPLAQFAPSARFGPPAAFASFIDRAHAAGLGIILDWVPAHFPSDGHGLAHFDGTALYEHQDPREGFHHDWKTLIYNFGRHEVRGFLIASALEWLEHYHVDGLRVDAVASMLYRDYSRREGEWIPNRHGGRENLEAVAFLRELNTIVAERCAGALVIAEESTAWPGVTGQVHHGGLGFAYKWNMGWMHDTLRYAERDPIYRRYHANDLSFGMLYAYAERFILPLSHDEVVYGKKSLLNKMPGDGLVKHAGLRAYFGFMWSHPGKKLLFMGGEFAQHGEWDHDRSPEWQLLDQPLHRGMQRLVRDLNRLYAAESALHALDSDPAGFQWLLADGNEQNVFAFLRRGGDGPAVLVACNFAPTAHAAFRIGVPAEGSHCSEIFNSDAQAYGGSGDGNGGRVSVEASSWNGQPASVCLRLPPLATLILRLER